MMQVNKKDQNYNIYVFCIYDIASLQTWTL